VSRHSSLFVSLRRFGKVCFRSGRQDESLWNSVCVLNRPWVSRAISSSGSPRSGCSKRAKMLIDFGVQMMLQVWYASVADKRGKGGTRVEILRHRSIHGRSFKTAVTQKAATWNDRPVDRSFTSILMSWETWAYHSIGRGHTITQLDEK
jgi:hypothetical protein